MEKDSKIYVAGHRGLVGSALVQKLQTEGYDNLILRNSRNPDLRDQRATQEFFSLEKPEYVFLAAAKVGGIQANMTYPAEFIYDNLQIQNNVIHSSFKTGVKKLMYFGSCCAYPTVCRQPIKEEQLLTGKLEPTNQPFAMAKLAGIEMCQAYGRQYGSNFISVIPANLFGPNDNFDEKNSHVVGMAMRLIEDARVNHLRSVTFGGTGAPIRDWLYVEELADACLFLMDNYNSPEIINIGTGKGISKKEIIHSIAKVIGFDGEILFDSNKPDGMMERVLDVSKINNLGWKSCKSLNQAIIETYYWFFKNKA